MPRKNRRKLHRAQRLAAEAHRAELRTRRLTRRTAMARSRAAADAVLRGEHVPRAGAVARPSAERVVGVAQDLMRLANVEAARQRRVVRLVRALAEPAPALVSVGKLPWYLLLAQDRWVRAPEDWRPPGGSARRKRDALATHLLARFPVSPFLLRALDAEEIAVARVPVEDEWAVGLVSWMGAGRPLRELVGTALLPTPLTRRMCHRFTTAPARFTPVRALRMAQVLGFGGPPRLVHTLARTRLGRVHGPDPDTGEPFWHGVVGWLCARPAFHRRTVAALDTVLGWMEAQRRAAVAADGTWTLKGRTPSSVDRAAEAWAAVQERPDTEFPVSGLLPLEVDAWSFDELASYRELAAESAAMRHCAAQYRGLVRKGKVSIWSLKHAGERRVTVEVALGAGRVVQAKRKANRAVSVEERRIVELWAARNRLTVAAQL